MMDEDDKAWLIEINTICNLQHSMNSKLDMFNKTALARLPPPPPPPLIALYNRILTTLFPGGFTLSAVGKQTRKPILVKYAR